MGLAATTLESHGFSIPERRSSWQTTDHSSPLSNTLDKGDFIGSELIAEKSCA